MTNPSVHQHSNGDVDIVVPAAGIAELEEQGTLDGQQVEQEGSVDPANLDHPEELMGE